MGCFIAGRQPRRQRRQKFSERIKRRPQKRRILSASGQSPGWFNNRNYILSYITVPYQKIQIPPRGHLPAKTIHAPVLKTSLFYENKERLFYFDSIVDSGADFCVFPANAGKAIGLDVYEGENIVTSGVGGKETLYFHKVKVEIVVNNQSWKFGCQAGFSTKLNTKGIGFLGRDGFFDLFQEVSFNQNAKMFRLKEF